MMNEVRLIDANALKDFYGKWSNKYTEFTKSEVDHYVDVAPTIDAVVQKHGEWLPYPSDMYMACSVCGMEYPKSKMPKNVGYCPNPNCGAKMDLESE